MFNFYRGLDYHPGLCPTTINPGLGVVALTPTLATAVLRPDTTVLMHAQVFILLLSRSPSLLLWTASVTLTLGITACTPHFLSRPSADGRVLSRIAGWARWMSGHALLLHHRYLADIPVNTKRNIIEHHFQRPCLLFELSCTAHSTARSRILPSLFRLRNDVVLCQAASHRIAGACRGTRRLKARLVGE